MRRPRRKRALTPGPAIEVEAPASSIGTIIPSEWGDTEITEYAAPWRRGIYRPNARSVERFGPGQRAEEVRAWATGPDDISPAVNTYGAQHGKTGPEIRPYDSICSCCYLGISHTVDHHDRVVAGGVHTWPPERIRAHLGADHVAWILSHPNAAAVARGRAAGEWHANNLGTEAVYRRLATLIEAGEVQP